MTNRNIKITTRDLLGTDRDQRLQGRRAGRCGRTDDRRCAMATFNDPECSPWSPRADGGYTAMAVRGARDISVVATAGPNCGDSRALKLSSWKERREMYLVARQRIQRAGMVLRKA